MIPVYDEEAGLQPLFDRLYPALDQLGRSYEVIFVDDGSRDRSAAMLKDQFLQRPDVTRVIVFNANYGQHLAIIAGFEHCRGERVVTLDADLQNPPEEVERLLAFAQRSGKEVIYTYYEEKQHSMWRNLGSRFANRVADFVLDKPKGFYLSSFRCVSAFVAREITRYQGPFPYIDGLILQVTHDIDRLMVRHLPRAVGRSNYTLRRLLRLCPAAPWSAFLSVLQTRPAGCGTGPMSNARRII